MNTMQNLQNWLESHACFDVQPVVVRIGKELWNGCRYKQTRIAPEGSQKAGQAYTIEMIYCLGQVPKVYGKPPLPGKSYVRKQQPVCFPFEDCDWYVAGYLQDTESLKTHGDSHPFGLNFLLAPWQVPDGTKIDRHEPKPYKRIAMAVE